jgi:HPt (histidine-containing phosphotransfer) domain-containing protein
MLTGPHPDFTALDQAVHQLKGSASSFGAQRVTSLCVQLRKAVQSQQTDVSMRLLHSIAEARQALNERLSMYVQLENQKKALCSS